MKLLIVDDHPLIRYAIINKLERELCNKQAREAGTIIEAINLFRREEFDAVIMDINLPDGNGLDAIRTFRSFKPPPPVLVLSMYAEENQALRAIHAGADGYLQKDCSGEELRAALRKLSGGGRYFSSDIMVRLIQKPASQAAHETLSDREYQVMCLLARGQHLTEIAADLGLSPNTISTYRTRILEKLEIENNAALTRYALYHQLID